MVPKMENAIAEKIIERTIKDFASLSPETATRLGIKGKQDSWDPPGIATTLTSLLHQDVQLMRKGVNFTKLDRSNKVQVKLLYWLDAHLDLAGREQQRSLSNPVDGPQVRLPLFLLTAQPSKTRADFEAYIARVKAFAPYIARTSSLAMTGSAQVPYAGLGTVDAQCSALMKGRPFEAGNSDSPLLEDFTDRLRQSELARPVQKQLAEDMIEALSTSVPRGCSALARLGQQLPTDNRLSTAAYASRLAWYTSTDMPADQLIRIADTHLDSIEQQIEHALSSTGPDSNRNSTIDALRANQDHRIAADDKNTQSWLNQVGGYVFNLDASLPLILSPEPDTDLEVRRMPSFMQGTGRAGEYIPATAASGTGIFFIDLQALQDYEVEAETYRYTIPGQHAIPLPLLSRLVDLPAFTEGWSLYSLRLPLAHDYYTSPLARIGQLFIIAQAIAAARIDLGVGSEQWSRDRAVEFLMDHVPVTRRQASDVVNRIITHPGAATAALAGMDAFERLHRTAESTMGDDFSDAAFNHIILRDGPLPLSIVTDNVQQWLDGQTGGKMGTSTPVKVEP